MTHRVMKQAGRTLLMLWSFFMWVSVAQAGDLKFFMHHANGQDGIDGLKGAYTVAPSINAKHVYVGGYMQDSVVLFERGMLGSLSFVKQYKNGEDGIEGIAGPYDIILSPDDKFVYVAGYKNDALAVFSRDVNSGELTQIEVIRNGVGDIKGLDGIEALAISPTGNHLYAASFTDAAVVVFQRHPKKGTLGVVEVQQIKVKNLQGASDLVVSPDGKNVYVSAFQSDSVLNFSRDSVTGQLNLQQTLVNQKAGIKGLHGVNAVAISSDGRFVYSAGFNDKSIVVFARDDKGQLSFNSMVELPQLLGVKALAFSPDNHYLYAATRKGHAMLSFQRDAKTGALSLAQTFKHGVKGVDGLKGAYAVSVSPDGEYVYVAAHFSHAIALFARKP